MQRICVSIVALLEKELVPTITDLLQKAVFPEQLHFSIVVQDEQDPYEKINELIKRYKADLSYTFLTLEECRGVGYARSIAQNAMKDEDEFFLQLDAHTRAEDAWDSTLVEWYNKEGWSVDYRFIYSTYPETYGYVSDLPADTNINDLFTNPARSIYYQKPIPGSLPSGAFREMIKLTYQDDKLNNYIVSRVPWDPDMEARNHQYFCAGFAFGRSEYFKDVPVDPSYSYTGEEVTTSIRFFAQNTKIIEPYKNVFYHDYEGNRFGRRPSWFVDDNDQFIDQKAKIPFLEFEEQSRKRLTEFMKDDIGDIYSVNHLLIRDFYLKYVENYQFS